LKTLEESYQRREQRLKEETDLIITQNSEKFKYLETEKADLQASNKRKISMLETAKNNEIESLKDIHRRALEQLRQEHEEEITQLRRLKEQEVSAATSAHAHTKSLQSLMDQVLSSTRDVSDLRQKIEVTHRSSLEERELSARARDEHLKQLQERLLRQQSENDEERTRLQGKLSRPKGFQKTVLLNFFAITNVLCLSHSRRCCEWSPTPFSVTALVTNLQVNCRFKIFKVPFLSRRPCLQDGTAHARADASS